MPSKLALYVAFMATKHRRWWQLSSYKQSVNFLAQQKFLSSLSSLRLEITTKRKMFEVDLLFDKKYEAKQKVLKTNLKTTWKWSEKLMRQRTLIINFLYFIHFYVSFMLRKKSAERKLRGCCFFDGFSSFAPTTRQSQDDRSQSYAISFSWKIFF